MRKKPADRGVRYRLRLTPRSDYVPATVNRYLLPHDRLKAIIRQHPVVLAPASASMASVLLATVIASITSRGDQTLILLLWIIWAFFLLRLAWIVVDWSLQYIAITDENFMMIGGLLTHTATAIPLDGVSSLTFSRSRRGTLMGYGAFRIGLGEGGPTSIDYVPYPEQLYLTLREAIQAAKAGGGSAPDEGVPDG